MFLAVKWLEFSMNDLNLLVCQKSSQKVKKVFCSEQSCHGIRAAQTRLPWSQCACSKMPV